MSRSLSLLGFASIFILSQSFAMDDEQPKDNELWQISHDHLNNTDNLNKVRKNLQTHILYCAKKLALLDYSNDTLGADNTKCCDLKNKMATSSYSAISHLDELLRLHDTLRNKKESLDIEALYKINQNIKTEKDALIQDMNLLRAMSSLIDSNTPENFAAHREKMNNIDNQVEKFLNGTKLIEMVRIVRDKNPKKLDDIIDEISFTPEYSRILGSVFYTLKTFSAKISDDTELCRQGLAEGRNVDSKIAETKSCKMNLESMQPQFFKAATHVIHMLIALYRTVSYDQRALEFLNQSQDIDSYFRNTKDYLKHAHDFVETMTIWEKTHQHGEGAQKSSFMANPLFAIDTGNNLNMRYNLIIQPWLKTWNFDFDTWGIYTISFEKVDTKDAQMVVFSETVKQNKKIDTNDIFRVHIGSSESIVRAACDEEKLFFNAMVLLTQAKGVLFIVDAADTQRVWTICSNNEYVSARFSNIAKQDRTKNRTRFPVFSHHTNN
jgi:hypothetical protein